MFCDDRHFFPTSLYIYMSIIIDQLLIRRRRPFPFPSYNHQTRMKNFFFSRRF